MSTMNLEQFMTAKPSQRLRLKKDQRPVYFIRNIGSNHMEVLIPYTEHEKRIARQTHHVHGVDMDGDKRKYHVLGGMPRKLGHIQIVRRNSVKVIKGE